MFTYSKASGQFHSLKGTINETIGDLTGLQNWQQSGKEEHAQGEAEYQAAQAEGYAEGTVDRLGGKEDAVVGALTGDRQQEASGMLPDDKHRQVSTSFSKQMSVTKRVRLNKISTREACQGAIVGTKLCIGIED